MIRIRYALPLLLLACKPLPPKPVDLSKSPDLCLGSDPGEYAGSCGPKYTKEGYSCVICRADSDCVTTRFQYCTAMKFACDDPRCAERR